MYFGLVLRSPGQISFQSSFRLDAYMVNIHLMINLTLLYRCVSVYSSKKWCEMLSSRSESLTTFFFFFFFFFFFHLLSLVIMHKVLFLFCFHHLTSLFLLNVNFHQVVNVNTLILLKNNQRRHKLHNVNFDLMLY